MTRSSRPQPWYASLNQPPRSPHGRNRRSAPSNHSDPLDGADPSTRRADEERAAIRTGLPAATWQTFNAGITIDPLPQPNFSPIDVQAMIDLQSHIINQMFSFSVIIEAPTPPTIPYAGIHSGEITAYRGWIVIEQPSGPMLCSLAHDFLWQPNTTIEGDLNKLVNKSAIQPIFGGVYAFRDHAGLAGEIEDANHRIWPCVKLDYEDLSVLSTWLGFAYGTVKLWGETVEHERGYRASFAKLTSIDGFIGVDGFDLDALRVRYHV